MSENADATTFDIAIIGGGAAGLTTAIFAARNASDRTIAVLDGAAKLGAKILVSGGGRCNVTNRVVTPADFCGGSPNVIKRVLAAFSVERTISFFREIGVELHEEECGKLFPDTNRARTVLDALLRESDRLGVGILTGHRVTEIVPSESGFRIVTPARELHAGWVVLATGGRSLPKSGSDGHGYALAESLGHSIVPPTPALVPLVLNGEFHAPLSGISQGVAITVNVAGTKPVHVRGPMLWSHFGVSGPAALDASRHWHRARVERQEVGVSVNFLPGEDLAGVERTLLALASQQPRALLGKAAARLMPARVAAAVLSALEIDGTIPLAHLPKDLRRQLARAFVAWPLPVRDSRGYTYAEVTAGGVPLSEVDPATLASRKCPNLFLVGEILDVDGRIGGFNFQWAWSTAHVAASALSRPTCTNRR